MRFAPLWLAAICLFVLFVGLDRTGFLDVREARDAQVARELIAGREVLTPLIGADPLFEKPVLAYGPDALTRLLGARGPLRSRQWRAGLAVALLLVTLTIGARHFGDRAGWLAGGVLATTLTLPLAARTDGTQLIATLLGWVACAGFADVLFGHERGRDLRLVVTWGALAAACVIAGPLPALWPVLALALHVWLARTPAAWRHARVAAGLVFVLGVALPWYGAMAERYGAAFVGGVAFFPYAAETRGAWFVGPVIALSFLVVGFFPWSALLPGATQHAAAWWHPSGRPLLRIGAKGPELAGATIEHERREERVGHFFIACLVAALVPILFYPGPPLPAALPALPAAALLCARFLAHLLEEPERVAKPLARATQMLAITGSAAAILLTLLAARVREASPDLRLLGTVLFVTAWLPFLANFAGRRRLAGVLIALPILVAAPVTTLRVLPAMEGYLNARAVAETMEAVAPPRAPLVMVESAPPSLRLYLRRNLVPAGPLQRPAFPAVLADSPAEDGDTYVAFRPAREREVARAAGVPLEILLRTPSLVLARVRVRVG